MILRSITDELLSLSKQYPIISVTGARQCGKTTLIKEIFKNYDYINLEEPSTRRKAAADPTSFLKSFNNNVIIDEAQYVPDIFSSVQYLSDADERPGRFIISGSQNFLLLKNITQSLAGRVAIIKLPTLTYNEVQNFDPSVKFEDFMIEGSYPRIYNLNINHTQFYLNYIETYIARDVKDLLDVKHLREFKEVMVALAGRSGQLLNYSELSKFVQVDQRTIKSWINILCSSYICFMLPPYFSNINKRLFKSPKLYFFDTGLLCHLLNIENSSEYYQSEFKGHIFENFVVSEVVKSYYNKNRDTRLYFYRDDNNTEVDLLNLSKDSKFKICEIKSSRLYKEKFTKNLRKVSSYLNIPKENTCVIYPDDFSWKDCGIQILSVQSYLDSLN